MRFRVTPCGNERKSNRSLVRLVPTRPWPAPAATFSPQHVAPSMKASIHPVGHRCSLPGALDRPAATGRPLLEEFPNLIVVVQHVVAQLVSVLHRAVPRRTDASGKRGCGGAGQEHGRSRDEHQKERIASEQRLGRKARAQRSLARSVGANVDSLPSEARIALHGTTKPRLVSVPPYADAATLESHATRASLRWPHGAPRLS